MNDHQLPDDPSQWPTDAYALLGVPRSASERDLKRAYAKLIRQYKPEHAPEQFRRIREAYEYTLRMVGFYTQNEPEAATNDDAVRVPDNTQPRVVSLADQADAHWNMAIVGDLPAAYEGLRQVLEQQPHDATLYARLFWLRRLEPSLDASREPWDWLLLGLDRADRKESLLTLLLEVARTRADLLTTEQARQLYLKPDPVWVAHYVARRWEVLHAQRGWRQMQTDLEALCKQPIHEQGSVWLGLMAQLLDWLNWETARDAVDLRLLVTNEIKLLQPLALQEVHVFDRMDYGTALVRSCREIPGYLSLVRNVIRAAWCQTEDEARPLREKLCAEVAEDPQRWLDHFNMLQTAAPLAMQYLESYLGNALYAVMWDEAETVPERLWQYARQAVGDGNWTAAHSRKEAFRFCLANNLEPYMILRSYQADHPNAPNESLPLWLSYYADSTALTLVLCLRRAFYHVSPARE